MLPLYIPIPQVKLMVPSCRGVNLTVTALPTGKFFVIPSDGNTTLLPQPSLERRVKISVNGDPTSALIELLLKPFFVTLMRTVFG